MVYQAYTEDQLFERLIEVVTTGARHQDYDRTVEHSQWCYQIMTGDDQDEILIRYKKRETDEQKEQRVSVTNSRTQYVGNKVFNLFSEVHRADRLVKNITIQGDGGEERVASLMENISHFHEEISLEGYLDDKFKYANFYDPNMFVVVEFDNSDPINRKPIAYPFEVMSNQAVDYEYKRGSLQYLITLQTEELASTNDDPAILKRYTLYGTGYSYLVEHIPGNADGYEVPDGVQVQEMEIEGEDQQQTVTIQRFETMIERVPAIRLGYLKDPTTIWRTFVSPLYPAEKLLTDMIWKKSEYDLAHALHGFYQKFIYVDDCDHCDGTGYQDHPQHGTISCQACEGTGVNHHTSTQDLVEIIRVSTKEEHIPLSEMVHYEQIPMELIRLQKEEVQDLERDVFNAVFGSNVLERSEVVTTATEHNYDWRMVNNTLLPYASKYEAVFKFITRVTADIRQEDTGLVVEYAFPGDFNLESVDEMIARRDQAAKAQAPWEVVWGIDLQILQKQHNENPAMIQDYKAKEELRPFNDKQLAEKQLVLSMLDQWDSQRILYLHFDEILANVCEANPEFSTMDFDTRRRLVAEETARKTEALQASQTPLFQIDTPGATTIQ